MSCVYPLRAVKGATGMVCSLFASVQVKHCKILILCWLESRKVHHWADCAQKASTCREGVVKKAAPTAPVEGGVNHNEELCAAFRALADLHDARGQFKMLLCHK